MIGDIGWQELLIILVIIALLFGAQRVSDMGKALGRGVRDFRAEAGGPSTPPEEAPTPPPPSTDALETLASLRRLHEEGLLTDEEFQAKQAAAASRG